jgi:hypothetical protein
MGFQPMVRVLTHMRRSRLKPAAQRLFFLLLQENASLRDCFLRLRRKRRSTDATGWKPMPRQYNLPPPL